MDYESLELELKNKLETFKQKWRTKITEYYNGNFKKMYRENQLEMFEDMSSIWETCTLLGLAERINNFATIKDLDEMLKEK